MMNGKFFKTFSRAGALSALCLAFAPGEAEAVGPVTSRLKTAKFSLMKGNWGSDHNSTTPVNFKWMAQIMADSGIAVDTFNLNTSQAPLTAENLAKYDVMVWYNVYRMYEFFTSPASATGNRIQAWYENGNKGLACFHQCVRHSGWTWWGTMMGREYDNFAGNTTGPLWLDAEGFADAYGPGSPDTINQSYSWNDEWYVYTGNPRGTPGTKMVWTTKRSAFPSSGWNMTAGEDKPVTWFREFGGGRFSLNGMYHTSVLATTTNPALRSFFNRSFISNMRFLAGYDGCKDSTFVEYNPKATHQAAGACVTPTSIRVGRTGEIAGQMTVDEFKVSFSDPGAHSLEIFDSRGARVASYRGEGAREYRFSETLRSGIYHLKIHAAGMTSPVSRRVVLL